MANQTGSFFSRFFRYRLPKTATAPFCPSEISGSVSVAKDSHFFKKLLTYVGPGLFISIGYIDPGNWATDIEAGSRYGFSLLCIIFISNLIAIFLQSLCVRVGIASRRDLAQLCRQQYRPAVNRTLWIFAEVAIIACDLAEVLGTALAFQLLFKVPLMYGIGLTALDTVIVLSLQGRGVRRIEAIILGFALTVALSFAVQMYLIHPDWASVAGGYLMTRNTFPDLHSVYLAVGILGATVMPHNLYLHTSLVQTRTRTDDIESKREAIKLSNYDTWFSLGLAFLINSAILILAGAVFHQHGKIEVTEIEDAYRLLEPLVGTALAPLLFGIALLASGQSSTLTGTIAGQVVMEGFLDLKIPCWQRRFITRALALIPAWIGVRMLGSHAIGTLLVLSQVVLSLQLPFAIAPLIGFASSEKVMGILKISKKQQIGYWLIFSAVTIANLILLMMLIKSAG